MNTLQRFVAISLLGFASVAGAQVNIPNPSTPGNSPESAVRLVATSDIMVDRHIARWIRTHYPGWNADPHEFMEIGMERYAVVYISAPDNPSRRIYFRVMKHQNEDDMAGFPDR
jgi:hypothetical protein